jgi:hypothetical protein
MSRLRKTVVPFHWSAITATFTQGTSASVNLASFLSNPRALPVTYAAVGSLPSGVTLSGATLSYNGTAAAAQVSVQFTATYNAFVAHSAVTLVRIVAAQVVNQAPLWTGSNPINLGNVTQSGNSFPLTGLVSDTDGPLPLVFGRTGGVLDTGPGGISVSSAGTLTVPANLPTGTYTVEVYAEDGYGLLQQVTGLTAVAAQHNRVNLSWDTLADATSYEIGRLDGSTWSTLVSSQTGTTYTDNTVVASTPYTYRVRGANSSGNGAYATASVTTPAQVTTERVEFADIPEIVFLEGFAETEEMGIFILDPINRTRPGDHSHLTGALNRIQRHPDDGGGNYSVRSTLGITLTSVSGSALGVSYNATTGQLIYDGAAQSDPRASWTVKLSSTTGRESATFNVRVMRPQVVYGTNASAVNTAKGWGATVATTPTAINSATTAAGVENVIAVLGGTYTDVDWLGSADREKCYILGEPYNKPYWDRTTLDGIGYGGCQVGYIKNFKTKNTQLKFSATDAQVLSAFGVRYTVYNCELVDWGSPSANAMEVSDYGGTQTAYCVGPYKFHCVNVFTRKGGGGSGGTKHLMYIHGRPNGYLSVINAKLYGVKAASQIKSVMKYNFVLNSYLHNLTIAAANSDGIYPAPSTADLTTAGQRAQSMLNIHGFCNAVVFNNDFTAAYDSVYGGTQVGAIHVQWRGYQFIGGDEPMAPDHSFWHYTRNSTPLPANLLNSCGYGGTQILGENWPLGGTPAYPALSEAPTELNGWPNTADTYMDPEFWDDIRTWNGATDVDAALADPTNPYTYKRFISHNRFYWLQEGTSVRQPWLRDDGFIAGGQYSSTFQYVGVIHPTTSNWTQRSANFSLNNQWSGWTDADVTHRIDGRGQRWEDVELSMYDTALAEADSTRTQLYGPFGTITRDGSGFYVSSTGATITVNGQSVDVNVTPSAEAGRPRYVTHVGGGSGPAAVTDPAGKIAPPSWFKLGSTG